MSSITFIGVGDKPYLKQVVDDSGCRIVEIDKDGKEKIISECKK